MSACGQPGRPGQAGVACPGLDQRLTGHCPLLPPSLVGGGHSFFRRAVPVVPAVCRAARGGGGHDPREQLSWLPASSSLAGWPPSCTWPSVGAGAQLRSSLTNCFPAVAPFIFRAIPCRFALAISLGSLSTLFSPRLVCALNIWYFFFCAAAMTSTALLPHPSETIPELLEKQGLEGGRSAESLGAGREQKHWEETPRLSVCSSGISGRPSTVVFVFPLVTHSCRTNQGKGGRSSLAQRRPCCCAPCRDAPPPAGQSSGVALRPIGHLRRFPRSPRWHRRAAGAGMDEFTLPAEPAALWEPDSEHSGLRCEQWVDLSETDAAELADLAESERAAQLSVAVELGQLWAPPRPGAPPGDAAGCSVDPPTRRCCARRRWPPPPPPPHSPCTPSLRRPGLCAVRPGPPVHRGAGQL